MTFLRKYSKYCALSLLLVAPVALSGQAAAGGTTQAPPSDQQGAPQERGAGTGGAATPGQQTRPSGADDYQRDATEHRTGQDERTRSDGQPFETGQDDESGTREGTMRDY